MKKNFILLFIFILNSSKISAQTTLNESFTATWSPTGAGWAIQNNSVPQGAVSWFQGNPAKFSANSGGPTDYYSVNFQSEAATPAGGISNFLITPTLALTNGAVIQFATRTNSTISFADRLQLRMSTAGTSTGAIGAGTTAVGSFTTLLLDINPNQNTLTATAVSGGSVNGYPNAWTVFSTTLSGITGTVTGRFAFRYFVSDGGANGANSDVIGIDDVTYTLPCATPTININPPFASICSGNSATFFGSGATTYAWNTGANTASLAVSPTVSTVYTLYGSSTPGCTSSKTIAVTVTLTPVVLVANATTCAGTPVTLSASGATTYSWNTGVTTSTISNAGTAATYTVTGNNGICANTKTVTVTIGSNLAIGVTNSSPSGVCAGNSATLSASGATSYTWLPSGSGSSIVVTPTANATYTVAGSTGACFGANTVVVSVNALPNVSITASSNTVCNTAGNSITVTASGASTYTWAPFASNATVVTVGTPTTAGSYSYGVSGTSAAGCVKTFTNGLVVVVCTGIANNTIENTNVAIFPNPFTNEVTISGVNGLVEVINTLGQVVLTTTVSETETINTTSLAKGVYFIKVKNADSKLVKTIKVIKN